MVVIVRHRSDVINSYRVTILDATALLLTKFAFLRSYYLSSSSFPLSADVEMDDKLSVYGPSYGKIVHRFGKQRRKDDEGV